MKFDFYPLGDSYNEVMDLEANKPYNVKLESMGLTNLRFINNAGTLFLDLLL